MELITRRLTGQTPPGSPADRRFLGLGPPPRRRRRARAGRGRLDETKESERRSDRIGMGADISPDALEILYRSRYTSFCRAAAAITDSREAGRDAVHDAFVEAVRKRSSFRGDGTLEAWVWPIVVQCALKARRRVEHLSDREPADLVWTDQTSDDLGEVRKAVAALPDRQRLLVFLRYYGDLDYEGIARAAGIRTGTVGAELHAAHNTLRLHSKEASHHA